MSSIRFVLFPLVVSVLLASTSVMAAPVAIVYRNYYLSSACSGEPSSSQSYSTGECTSTGANRTRSWHCTADGSKVYSVSYSDSTCTTVSAISQYSSQMCSSSTAYECRNATLGPALPFEYPKNGLFESIRYYNTSSRETSKTCASTSNPFIRTTSSQRTYGECEPSPSRGTSSKEVCTGGGGYNVYITYGDLTCTKPIKATAETNGCSEGYIGRCNGAPIATVELPTQGYISYSDDGCKSDKYPPSATFIAKDACIWDVSGSFKMACETDAATGIATATVSRYGNFQCTGTPTTSLTYLADGSQCVPETAGSDHLRRKYQCNFQAAAAGSLPSDSRNFDTTGDNSATAIGRSTFGLIATILIGTVIAASF